MDWTAISVIVGLMLNAVVVGAAWGDTRRALKHVCQWQENADLRFTAIGSKFEYVEAREATAQLGVEHRLTKLEGAKNSCS